MPEKTLDISAENISLHIKVEHSTVLIGMRRARLKVDAEKETDIDRKLVRMYTYSDMAACTSGTLIVDGKDKPWPPDFDTFLSLPERLISPVEEAVYKLNPHWLPDEEGTEAEKKAPMVSSSG
jgi:hypothetical protein